MRRGGPRHRRRTRGPRDQEPEEEEESWQTAARAEVHWDDASTDGEEPEEELGMTGRRDNVELLAYGNSGLYNAMTGDVVPLIDKHEMHLSE